MAIDVVLTVAFSIKNIGWSEQYYASLADDASIPTWRETIARTLVEKRMRLMGAGVFADAMRISNVRVRRDADLTPLNLLTISPSHTGGARADTRIVKVAVDAEADLPHVALVVRVENINKVYHSEHAMSGLPQPLVGNDGRYIRDSAWTKAIDDFESYLTANSFTFPNLSRVSPNQDRAVTRYLGGANNIITCDTGGLLTGDRVRLINMVKPRSETVRSYVGRIGQITATDFGFDGPFPPTTWSVGPKSVAHREERIYVPITSFTPERFSHRDRGRVFGSPRGRRVRR